MQRKIVQIRLPFIEKTGSKNRPALVLSEPLGKHNVLVVAYITSNIDSIEHTDVPILSNEPDFEMTGLKFDSLIRLSKLATVSYTSIEGIMGVLPKVNNDAVDKILLQMFQLSVT